MKPMQFIYAGRLERVLAYIIDTVILLLPHAILYALLGEGGATVLAGFLCNLAYFTHFTRSAWQCSPGQRLLTMYVVHANGTPMNTGDALERFLAFSIPSLPMYASFVDPEIAPAITGWLALLWFVPILVREERTGIHDQLCKTRVVVGKADA